ncbi:SDR family NAD(P)-dependent oxidoreductase [Sphingobium sp. EM0848]|uniref:SDR family NAD(P)-dependent oxidoreductase n=1 Tax=Sphingobium sp. EM0848 TaxID=2743473 RepID=UPI00159C19C9|nr:SDR family NAD(P)-dependent oxidoreductase [Sphingobium sp. EM0848]
MTGRVTSRFGAQSTALEVIEGIDLAGRATIVTGGASGVGVETARALAHAGASVLLAVRDLQAGTRIAAVINVEVGADRVSVDFLELGSLASVRAFAERWGERPLSLLINNAGVMACPQGTTEDGFETQFAVNHLGHFLLTTLLVPALEKGVPSRVIAVSSSAHALSDVDFDDPDFRKRPYDAFQAYGQSKTANALFALEFDRRHRDRGIHAFSLMPGVIQTNLGRHVPDADWSAIEHLTKTVEQGASTSVWAATAPELEGKGGLYLENCAEAEVFVRGMPRGTGVMPYARDPDAARRLWALSEEKVGLAVG